MNAEEIWWDDDRIYEATRGKSWGSVGSRSMDLVSSYFVHVWKLISSSRAVRVHRLKMKKSCIGMLISP